MKQLFLHITGNIFYQAAYNKRYNKSRSVSIFNWINASDKCSDQDSPHSIDGAYRSRQAASVDKTMILNVFQYDFHAPSKKSIEEKEQNQFDQILHVRVAPPADDI